MEVLLTHVAGVDVHKEMLMVTTLIGDPQEPAKIETFECSTFTDDLRECGKKLLALGIKHVAMEATGVYWKPVFNAWQPMGLVITLANAHMIKNVPGRKTDVKDSQWIAQLHRNGLVPSSYIPEMEFQQMRLLNRHRNSLTGDLTRVKGRLQRVLEDANIKLGSILSDIMGVAGTAVIEAIIGGVRAPHLLAHLVRTNVKRKEDAERALNHCLRQDHIFLIQELYQQIKDIKARIQKVEEELGIYVKNHEKTIQKLVEIPGISLTLAQGIVAEATTKMEVFSNERKFAAWAGVAPGNNESAQKKKPARLRQGNHHLKRMLILAANGAARSKGSYYQAKHNALRFRLGSYNKATVAIANRLARAIYRIIKEDIRYEDLGTERGDAKNKQTRRLVVRLRKLGYRVDLTPAH